MGNTLYMVWAVGIALLIGIQILLHIVQKNRKPEFKIVKPVKKKRESIFLEKAYHRAAKSRPLRRAALRLKERLRAFYPEERRAEQLAAAVLLLLLGLCAGFLAAAFAFRHVPLFLWLAIALYAYVAVDQLLYRIGFAGNLELLQELDGFLNEFRSEIQVNASAVSAIQGLLLKRKPTLRIYLEHVLGILEEGQDYELEYRRFAKDSPSRFLDEFLFAMICFQAYEQEPGHLQELVDIIRRQVNQEILAMQNEKYMSIGWSWIPTLPAAALPAIASWAMSIVPETSFFYEGAAGEAMMIVLFALSAAIYHALMEMLLSYQYIREDGGWVRKLEQIPAIHGRVAAYEMEHPQQARKAEKQYQMTGSTLNARHYFLKKAVYGVGGFFVILALMAGAHFQNRLRLENGYGGVILSSSLYTKEQDEEARRLVQAYAREGTGEPATYEEYYAQIKTEGKGLTDEMAAEAAVAVVSHLERLDSEHLQVEEVMAALLAAGLLSQLPGLALARRARILQPLLRDEVIHFQVILEALRYSRQITRHKAAQWLYWNSTVFQPGLGECLSRFPAGEDEALEWLYRTTEYAPFRQVCREVAEMEQVGIVNALSGNASNREFGEAEKAQETEFRIRDQSVLGDFLCVLPFLAVVIGYLVAPITYYALVQLAGIMQQF